MFEQVRLQQATANNKAAQNLDTMLAIRAKVLSVEGAGILIYGPAADGAVTCIDLSICLKQL